MKINLLFFTIFISVALILLILSLIFKNKDKKMVKRINELIKDIDRNGLLTGIGKPEPLKHRKACSRRITDEHRLIYYMDNIQNLIIYSCKYHYED